MHIARTTSKGASPHVSGHATQSVAAAAAEATVSRLYAGIHSPFNNNNGLAQGQCIGQMILERIAFMR